MIIKPIWLIVEYARIFLMSLCVRDTTAANSAVVAPTIAITVIATDDSLISSLNRTSKYGPALTIVAA